MKKFKEEFELYLGSLFFLVTFVLVTVNVITRYFLKFTYHWAEEVAVGCFIWTIFLGFANAYRTDSLIGVEALMKLLPRGKRLYVEFFTSIVVFVLSAAMLYFSYSYVMGLTKITAALEVSYLYIYISMVLAFLMITIYSVIKMIHCLKLMRGSSGNEEVEEVY